MPHTNLYYQPLLPTSITNLYYQPLLPSSITNLYYQALLPSSITNLYFEYAIRLGRIYRHVTRLHIYISEM